MGRLAAGKLNRQITIQRKIRVRDPAGQSIDTWVDHARVWANWKTITGSALSNQEFITGDIEVDRVVTSIRIRYREDLKSDMRVVYRGKFYDIKAVLPDEEFREYLDISVAEGANLG